MKKICCVVNSRANYARIKTVLSELKNRTDCELQIIVGASGLLFRYGDVAKIMRADGFEISREIYSVVEGNEPVVMAKTTGVALLDLASTFHDLKPDIVLTVADRHETLATAIAASYMNIPVVHTQGGEITGSIDESVRHACTKLSHLHFPATKKAYENILQMGEEENRIFLVGCPALDLINQENLNSLETIIQKYMGQTEFIKTNQYLLVLLHPDTQDHTKSGEEAQALLKSVESIGMPTIWLWPNVDSGTDLISKVLRTHKERKPNSKIFFVRNFSPEDFVVVLKNASCIVGNSSSGIREASLTGTPSVTIGSRQAGRETSENVITVREFESEKIAVAIKNQLQHGKFTPNYLYGNGNAGRRIAEILCTVNIDIEKRFIRRHA
jgi:UDP-hydrolysing UDP-N-acetyl-D-glucosamine 2-epimerase